jgi:DNA uptake protein ComE-like DNA-binding protein
VHGARGSNEPHNAIHYMIQAGQSKIQAFAYVISACAAVCFSLGFLSGRGAGKPASAECPIRLESRINPNDAPVESLVRLPNLGSTRAAAIVVYREDCTQKSGDGAAFQNCDDLQRVSGIGPKTAQSIGKWLKFD